MTFDVYPNDGDTITENRETRSRARANNSEYVERGLTITLNGDGTFDVGAGFAIVRDGTDAWEVEDETGTTGVALASTTTTNYIYLTFDPTASDVEGSVGYHVDTDQTPPTTPSLFIATADESAGTTTGKNREPDVAVESVSGPVSSTPIQNFEGTDLTVDGNGNLNAAGLTQIATGTVTATGGASPAVDTTLQGVSTDQLLDYTFIVYVDADPAFNAGYAWNFDFSDSWDDTNGEKDIDLVVSWDTDPGSGNDVTLRWEVLQP